MLGRSMDHFLWIVSMGSQVRFGSCNSDIHTPTPDVIKEMRD